MNIIIRRRWIVLGVFFACVLASMLVTIRMTPVYEGVARMEMHPVAPGSDTGVLERLLDPAWARTQVELITSGVVLDRTADQLGLGDTEELGNSLTVTLVPESQIVDIAVERPSPVQAAEWANAVAQSFLEYRRDQAIENAQEASQQIARRVQSVEQELAALGGGTEDASSRGSLQAQLASLQAQLIQIPDVQAISRGGGNIITPAEPGDEPVRPKPITNLLLASVLGAMLGLGAAFVMEHLDDKLNSPDEIESKVSAPALGYVPLIKHWANGNDRELADDRSLSAPAAESYQTLGINLVAAGKGKPPRSVLITSASAAAGKSTTSANLAAVMARAGHKVILVSGDLRKPSTHKFFGLPDTVGLVDVVHSFDPLDQALQADAIPNFRLLSAGGIRANPTETLGSRRFGEVLEELKSISDVVIIDSTPILGLGDASVLAAKVDGVILVVNMNNARGRELTQAARQVDKAGGKLIGCVINGLDASDSYSNYYGYGGYA
ncbi:hypothetical protein BH23ACT12_BH23ACT12_22150 [soil metagenome]